MAWKTPGTGRRAPRQAQRCKPHLWGSFPGPRPNDRNPGDLGRVKSKDIRVRRKESGGGGWNEEKYHPLGKKALLKTKSGHMDVILPIPRFSSHTFFFNFTYLLIYLF